jgi:hypothetical protein
MLVSQVLDDGITAVIFFEKSEKCSLKVTGFPTTDLVKVLEHRSFNDEG